MAMRTVLLVAAMSSNSTASAKDVQHGLLLMALAMLILPGIDGITKYLSDSISPGEIAWSRFFFQTLFLLPVVLRGGSLRVGPRLWVHGARGVLIALGTLMFFTSLGSLPLADAISIFFVGPFILTLLSAAFLGERVGWRRLLAVAAGFAGALIVIRPSYETFGLTALLPVGAATAYSCYMVLTRWLVRDDSIATMQFYTGVFGGLALSMALWFGAATDIAILTPSWPTAMEWIWLATLGIIAAVGHWMIVIAVRRVGASMVAPLQYLEIVGATILGLVFFGDFPDGTTWLGVAIIIGSGLYVFYRERKLSLAADARSAGVAKQHTSEV
jgi:S-adenosylmethionine uptake transporter